MIFRNGAVSGAGIAVMRPLLFWLASALLATALAACETVQEATVRDAAVVAPVAPAGPDPVQEPTDVKYYPSMNLFGWGWSSSIAEVSDFPSAISRMRSKRPRRTSPPGLGSQRAVIGCVALILPTRLICKRSGWGAKPFRS